jgi:hypothetical protein
MTNNTLSPEGLTWRILGCGNPNKAWIINDLGIKVTKLISVKTARLIVAEHNRALTCAETTREQWQPIETAPHGKWVLICAFDKNIAQACWHRDGYWNAFDDTRIPTEAATHWMPLPTPPKCNSAEAQG